MASINNLPDELLYRTHSLLRKRKHVRSISFLNRRFSKISREIYPLTIFFQELSQQELRKYNEYLVENPSFQWKVKNVKLNNIIPYNEQQNLQLRLDSLFDRFMRVTEIELNLVYINRNIIESFITNIIRQSSQNRIALKTIKINNAFRRGDMESAMQAVDIDIKETLRTAGLHLQNLLVNRRRDNAYPHPMHFIAIDNSSRASLSSVKKIELVDFESTIDILCLEFFASDQLPQLTTLNIFLRTLFIDIGVNNDLWDRFRVFCNNRLRSYNICIRNRNGDLLFAYDNRSHLEDRYVNQRY